MSNWVIQNFLYAVNPSLYNYIRFKWYHFHFCQRDDLTISSALYLDNLFHEVQIELSKHASVNKASLTLAVVRKILKNQEAKQLLISFLDESGKDISRERTKDFLNKLGRVLNGQSIEQNHIENIDETVVKLGQPTRDFPVRSYVIATHIYLEINNNEMHYFSLIHDTTALKEFILAKFKPHRIPGRIEDMKGFSYKKILQSKIQAGAKGQLIPQIKQIASNPEIFGEDVSEFAENLVKDYTSPKK